MIEPEILEFDGALAQIRDLEASASASKRASFRSGFVRSWLYHELQVEGVSLVSSDIERALKGEEGVDYCDGLLLAQVRAYHGALEDVQRRVAAGEFPTIDTLFAYAHAIDPTATGDPTRTSEGATEQYKHDVSLPAVALDEARDALGLISSPPTSLHPIEAAVDALYQLAKSWPLARWSAASSRLVVNQYLMLNGYPPIVISGGDRERYYRSMHYDERRLRQLSLESLWYQLSLVEKFFLGRVRDSRRGAVRSE